MTENKPLNLLDKFSEEKKQLIKQNNELKEENKQLKQFIMELTTKNTGRIDLANGHSYNVKYILKGD